MGIHSCNESQSFGFLRMLSIVWTSIWTSEAEEVIEELQQLQTRRQNESWRIISYRINLHYTAVAWPCFTVFLWHEEKVNDLHLNTVSRYLDPDLDLWSIATPHGLVGRRSNSMIFSKLPLSKSLWNVWRVSSHLSLLVVVWNLTWRRETKSPVAFELLVDILMHLLIFISILLWDPQTLETHEAWNSNLTVPSLSGML